MGYYGKRRPPLTKVIMLELTQVPLASMVTNYNSIAKAQAPPSLSREDYSRHRTVSQGAKKSTVQELSRQVKVIPPLSKILLLTSLRQTTQENKAGWIGPCSPFTANDPKTGERQRM